MKPQQILCLLTVLVILSLTGKQMQYITADALRCERWRFKPDPFISEIWKPDFRVHNKTLHKEDFCIWDNSHLHPYIGCISSLLSEPLLELCSLFSLQFSLKRSHICSASEGYTIHFLVVSINYVSEQGKKVSLFFKKKNCENWCILFYFI